MSLSFHLPLLFLIFSGTFPIRVPESKKPQSIDSLFSIFVRKYSKSYNSISELHFRKRVFENEVKKLFGEDFDRVMESGSLENSELVFPVFGRKGFEVKIYAFADLEDQEFFPQNFKRPKPKQELFENKSPLGSAYNKLVANGIDPISFALQINRGHRPQSISLLSKGELKAIKSQIFPAETPNTDRKLQTPSFSKERFLENSSRSPDYQGIKANVFEIDGVEYPSSINWSDYLTIAKDQGGCNACYAFAGLSVLEANYMMSSGRKVDLSEQEVLDCSGRNLGCTGGLAYHVFDYVKRFDLSFESDYKYVERKEACKRNEKTKRFRSLLGYHLLKNGVLEIIKALQLGSVAVAMHAPTAFKYYYKGFFEGEGCPKGQSLPLNHSIHIYGYELKARRPYFLAKNVWGSGWGDEGRFKIGIGPLEKSNLGYCHIADTETNVIPIIDRNRESPVGDDE